MMQESTMTVGVIAILLTVLVRSGLLGALVDRLKKRAGGGPVKGDGQVSPPPAPSLIDLLRQRRQRRREAEAEDQVIRDILEGKDEKP